MFTIIKIFLLPRGRESTLFHILGCAKSLNHKQSFWKGELLHNAEAIFRKWWPNIKALLGWRNITSPALETKFTTDNFKTLKRNGKKTINRWRTYTLSLEKLNRSQFKRSHFLLPLHFAKLVKIDQKVSSKINNLNIFLISWTRCSLCQTEAKMKLMGDTIWCGCSKTISKIGLPDDSSFHY